MDELKKIVEEKLKETEEQQLKQEEVLEKLEKYKDYPDTITQEEEIFREIFKEENSDDFESIIKLCGLYEFKEPQIEKALEYLYKLIEEKKESINNEMKSIKNDVEQEVYYFISIYDENTYVTIEMIDKIKSVTEESEELLEFLYNVLINNSKLEIEKAKQKPKEDEREVQEELLETDTIEDLEKERDSINITSEQKKEDADKRKEYIEKIKAFLNNNEYKELDNNLYYLSSIIMENALYELSKEDLNIDFDFIENDMELDDIREADKEYLELCPVKNLFDAYESKDIEKIKTILNIYNSNNESDIKVYLTNEGMKDYSEILRILENKYNVKENLHAVKGMNYEEYKKEKEMNNIDNDSYELQIIYSNILELLKDRKLDESTKKELDKLIDEIKKIINKQDDIDKINAINDYYNEHDNYIVLYDKEQFMDSYNKMLEEHPGEAFELKKSFCTKLAYLITADIQHTIASKKTRNIHTDRGKNNKHEILELRDSGSVRISFKRIPNAKVKDDLGHEHEVLMIIHTCYGKIDKQKKHDNLNLGVDIFERTEKIKDANGKTRFENLADAFSDENISKEANEELEEAIKLMENLKNELDKEQFEEIEEITVEELLDMEEKKQEEDNEKVKTKVDKTGGEQDGNN